MKETWKEIPGFPGYLVSDLGRISSDASGTRRVLRGSSTRDGYKTITLHGADFKVYMRVHRLVLEVFVGSCPQGYECDHINGIRDDNRLVNLRWVTRSENVRNPVTYPHLFCRKTRARRVLCKDMDRVFDSVTIAARELKLTRQSVNRVCLGQLNHTHGYHFIFLEDAQ